MFAFGSVSAFKRTLLPSYSNKFSYDTSLRREAWIRMQNYLHLIRRLRRHLPLRSKGKADAEFRINIHQRNNGLSCFPSRRAARESGMRLKSATSEWGFRSGSSWRIGTK